MATPKRFYWMKLKESFMTSDTIDYFMSQPDGANYVVLYQMLCLKTINTEGRLSRQIGEIIIPFDAEKIQRDCKWFSIDTVRVALKLYQAVGLVYEDVDGTLVLSDYKNLVGSESDAAARMRSSRAHRVPELPKGVTDREQSANIVTPEIEIRDRDKRIEIEREKEVVSGDTPPAPPVSEIPKSSPLTADYSKTNFSAAMIAKVEEWLQYKKERREGYKQIGLQSLVTQIQNNVNRYGEDAVMDVITASMAANYKGIVFDRLKDKKGANSHEISSGRCNGVSAPPKKYGHYV